MAYNPNHCSLRGRTVLIEYKCGRCGTTAIEPYAVQQEKAEGNLQCFKPPYGWLDDAPGVPFLMCPSCKAAFYAFLKNEQEQPK